MRHHEETSALINILLTTTPAILVFAVDAIRGLKRKKTK